jgi:hypothetical protein
LLAEGVDGAQLSPGRPTPTPLDRFESEFGLVCRVPRLSHELVALALS